MHKPLYINSITLSFPGKICFSKFSAIVYPGSRIALIGQNGTGKTSLLKMLNGTLEPTEGSISLSDTIIIGYVPQLLPNNTLSGAEQFNAALSQALAQDPDVLLLDEPTNHLDPQIKKSLLRMLSSFEGTLIIASHDEALLQTIPTEFWHIKEGRVSIITGNYNVLLQEQEKIRSALQSLIKQLNKDQEKLKTTAQHEQKARAQRRRAHKDENDRSLRELRKEHASKSQGKSQGKLNKKKQQLAQELQELYIPEIIKPTFTLHAPAKTKKYGITIHDGACGYSTPLLTAINLTINTGERVAITGPNASGKTTFLKALIDDPAVAKTGTWLIPGDIGYLDQHYSTLQDDESVQETLERVTLTWTYHERRKLLATFLFRDSESVEKKVVHLSGGEKARLSLACIAATNPSLLILDEITNNLDHETKEHVAQVLKAYTGTLLVVSHDDHFLEKIALTRKIKCAQWHRKDPEG